MQLDLQRCITDFPYYAKSLLKIKDINANLVPLNLNPPQARLHIVMDNMIQNRRLQRVIVLKARREGISTYAEARIFHCSHLNENTDSVVIAHEKDSGSHIFEMCRLYYECLPVELRPMTRYSSKKELVFENPDKVERIQNPGMRSSIEVLTAGKKNVARGASYHNLHCCFGPEVEILQPGWGLKCIDDILIGDFVLDEFAQPVEVVDKFIYDNDDECINITLWNNSGLPLVVTPNHRLMTRRGLKAASDLTIYDELVFPVLKVSEEISSLEISDLTKFSDRPQGGGYKPKLPRGNDIFISDKLGIVLGLFLAEGSFGSYSSSTGLPNRVTFSIHEDEVTEVLEMLQIVQFHFGFEAHPYYANNSKTCNIECQSAIFGRFMYSLFGPNKNIPNYFMACGRSFVKGLVKGYLYGDSNFRTQAYAEHKSDVVKISSVRPQLIMWLRSAILGLGYGYSGVEARPGGIHHGRNEQRQYKLVIAGDTFRHIAKLLNIPTNFQGRPHIQKWNYSEKGSQVYIQIRDIGYTQAPTVVDLQVNSDSHLYLTGACITHNSELGSWTFAEDVIPSLIPTIPKTERSIIVFESTAKGVGNFFHQEWLRAVEGESNFHAFFLPWFELPEYTREFNQHKEKDLFSQTLNDEEKELLRVHKLTLEQLYWRRWTIADLRGDVELFRQEYPATPEEAFIVSGSPIFNRQALREMAIKCTEPFFRGCLTARGLAADEHGEFKVWQMPEKKGIYCLGVDVADGGAGGDYSCIEVFRKLSAPYFAEQVAEWHGRVDPYNFAHVIERIGKLFNSALVSIEVNAHGLATQQELQRDYWNLYQQTYLDRYDQKLTTKVGWETTVRTKPLLIAFGSHCIADKTIIIHSGELIREGMTFIRDSVGGAGAAGNGYDDRIMATLVSLYTMHQAIGEEPPYEKTGVVRDPMAPAPMYIDPEFAWLLNYGHQNDYEDTWLNY